MLPCFESGLQDWRPSRLNLFLGQAGVHIAIFHRASQQGSLLFPVKALRGFDATYTPDIAGDLFKAPVPWRPIH
jgi:hypothetical protein